jgi:hypothetical protein
MNITAAATPAIAIVVDRLLVHHAARADLVRLDLSTRGGFFMRIDRLTGIRVLLEVRDPGHKSKRGTGAAAIAAWL